MNSRKMRRYGRQIPADIMIGTVFALSLFCGFPIAFFLKRNYPQLNDYLRMLLALIGGFLVLVALCFLIGVATWLLARARQFLARKK